MDQHRQLLEPKFDAVERQFAEHLAGLPGVSWSRPEGGYFIDLVTPPGRAKNTVELARKVGITLSRALLHFALGAVCQTTVSSRWASASPWS